MEHELAIGYQEASRLFWEDKQDEALGVCLSLLKRFPANVPLLNLAGSTLYRKKMFPEAESLLSAANTLAPDTVEVTLNLVRVLRRRGMDSRAVCVLEKALVYTPQSSRLLSVLGEIHYFGKRFEDAADAFEKLVRIAPDNTEAMFRLACALQEIEKTEAAYALYNRILAVTPAHPDACVNLAQIHKSLGDHEAAMELYRKSAELMPDDSSYGSRVLFCRNYSFVPGKRLLREAVTWAEKHADPLLPTSCPAQQSPVSLPLRLGFISADFTMHPVGALLLPILERIDRKRFEVHCFSNVQIEDEMTRQYKATINNFHEIKKMDDSSVEALIRKNGIDILVDLSGHTNFNRLGVLARKPAPVQIMWLGYFNTTGMKAMDYILADHVNIPPGHEKYYREKVLRLGDSFFPYSPSMGAHRSKRHSSGTVTYGCFNDSAKINDTVLEAWAAILNGVPESRMLLKSRTFSDPWVRDHFIERAMRAGMPHRIVFLGPSGFNDYLREYSMVDIALDPFPYSGGATTADALSTGTPVLTCPFDSFASRLSASILHACDMDCLICNSLDDYVDKAIELGRKPDRLDNITNQLNLTFRASRFCDVTRFTRNFETTLLAAAGVAHQS